MDICRVLWKCRAVLRKCRALLRKCSARLRNCRALFAHIGRICRSDEVDTESLGNVGLFCVYVGLVCVLRVRRARVC